MKKAIQSQNFKHGHLLGSPNGSGGKQSSCNAGGTEMQVQSLNQEDPLKKETPVFLPGETHGQRSLAGYSP